MAGRKKSQRRDAHQPERVALLLQGGGALGSYQAGVYEELHRAGIAPDWVAGISIGALNAGIIAGNAPDQRVPALRAFWERISEPWALPAMPLADVALPGMAPFARAWMESVGAWRALTEGQRGFFHPRSPLAGSALLAAEPGKASFYDTAPMLDTLREFIDFDRLNSGEVRVSVGAVDVASSELVYFDNHRMQLDARHFLASGSLPPGFPATEIDGRFYWDGGLVSNTPLALVLDEDPCCDSLVFQVDLWDARGEVPTSMMDVLEREKEIRYASRTQRVTRAEGRERHLRRLLREVLAHVPEDKRAHEAWCRHADRLAQDARISVVQLVYQDRAEIGHFKDYQFGRPAMRAHWRAGVADAARALAHPEWLQLPSGEQTFVSHELERS